MCEYCKKIEKKHFENPVEGQLRVWHIPQIPMEAFKYPVKTVEEAKLAMKLFAQYDLFQWKHRVKPDYANGSGLEVFEFGQWSEWTNEDGDDIMDAVRNEK